MPWLLSPVSTTRVHCPSLWAELTARQLGFISWHHSTRPEFTGVKNALELTGRQLGPSIRAVNPGSGNRALDKHTEHTVKRCR